MRDWDLIQDLFEEGLELDDEERRALLAPYQHKSTVVREVSELWEHSNPDKGKLKHLKVVSQEFREGKVADQIPQKIGNYKVIEEIGQGMSGSVYKACKSDATGRTVALKVLKQRMNDKESERRFLAERDMLFMLNHPNVALVLDSDFTESGRPYLVMEYLDGEPITEYCDKHQLNIYRRIDLFCQVCVGLAEAHKKGIIHRDIKPGNIIVVQRGGKAVPKILDFGIAKWVDNPDQSDATVLGAVMGTPAYMSPEQAAGRKEQTYDIRTDIYSLGVLLYELMIGVTPLDREICEAPSLMGVCRVIDEKDPLTPAKRIAEHDFEEKAAMRGTTPSGLRQAVSGELEWIVMKAIAKLNHHRYQSCEDFHEDLTRYLKGEAVRAGSPSQFYFIRKAISKHRGIALFLGLFVTAFILLSQAWFRASKAERLAVARAQEANQALQELQIVQEFTTEIFKGVQPINQERNETGLALLERAEQQVSHYYHDRPELEAATRFLLGESLWSMGVHENAIRQFRQALALYQDIYGDRDRKTLECTNKLAFTLTEMGQLNDAEKMLRESFEVGKEEFGMSDPITLISGSGLAYTLRKQGRLEEALSLFTRVLAIQREMLKPDDQTMIATLNNYAGCLGAARKYDEAEVIYQEVYQLKKRYLTPNHPSTLSAMHNLAWIAQRQNKLAEAEKLYQRVLALRKDVLGPLHPDTLQTLTNLAAAIGDQGRPATAVELLLPVLEPAREQLENHPDVLRAAHNLGHFLMMCERYEEAEQVLSDTLEGRKLIYGEGHPSTLLTWFTLAENRAQIKGQAQGDAEFLTLIKVAEQHLGVNSPTVQRFRDNWPVKF